MYRLNWRRVAAFCVRKKDHWKRRHNSTYSGFDVARNFALLFISESRIVGEIPSGELKSSQQKRSSCNVVGKVVWLKF